MTEVHIGKKGTEVVIPAGYRNRAQRRRMKKMNLRNVHKVIPEYAFKHEDKKSEVAN